MVVAAMETTSSAISRTLQLLSEHEDVQEKLRSEIREARADKEYIDFDELMNLPYMDAVCRETLRLYVFNKWLRYPVHRPYYTGIPRRRI